MNTDQKRIPCTFMRGGTSKGIFLDLRDLPDSIEERDEILLKIMGSPDIRQINGMGGAQSITSKVVMVQPSEREGIDVDYLFAQVAIDRPMVDTKPSCGNMMSGIPGFGIEKGWVKATDRETKILVYNFNTDSVTQMIVQTPNGKVNYTDGDFHIDGVEGTGAPIIINFFHIDGGTTDKLFPTGNRKDRIQGIDVSIIDAGNIIMLVKAADIGLSGMEGKDFFEKNRDLMSQIESIRIEAGELAGMGDVSESVLPKVGILSAPRKGGTIKSQYFTPDKMHPTHAVSGAVGIAAAVRAKGTVASEISNDGGQKSGCIFVEHRSGSLPVELEVEGEGVDFTVVKAGTVRTARKIMDGYVYF